MVHPALIPVIDTALAAWERVAVINALKEVSTRMATYTASAPGLRRTTSADIKRRKVARQTPGITGALQRLIPGGETGYLDPVEPTPGIIPAIQRILPGGETGMTSPGVVPTPGIQGALQRIIPGGQTGLEFQDYTPGTHGRVVKIWYANGTPFALNEDGTISVRKKNGQIKTYRPYKPTVFGKNPDAKKFIKVAKKHQAMYKDLHKIFKTTKVRK